VQIRFSQVTSKLSLPDLPAGDFPTGIPSLAARSPSPPLGVPSLTARRWPLVIASAALTVKMEARNLDTSAHDATIDGVVAGVSTAGKRFISHPVKRKTVLFSPKSDPALNLQHPQVWWPVGMGAHPLYQLEMNAAV